MSAALQIAEPPARYLDRPALVVDCSVVAGLVFREPWYDAASQLMNGQTPHAPHVLIYEIGSVALKKHRRGEAHALPGFEEALGLDVELHGVDMAHAFALAQRYQLTAYDASYLWLAAELKCPLATFDETLAQAARAHLAGLG